MVRKVTREQLDKIKETNRDEYDVLLLAAAIYTENKNSEHPIPIVEKETLSTITSILDKHNVEYVNDL
jgi:hypothetical protein